MEVGCDHKALRACPLLSWSSSSQGPQGLEPQAAARRGTGVTTGGEDPQVLGGAGRRPSVAPISTLLPARALCWRRPRSQGGRTGVHPLARPSSRWPASHCLRSPCFSSCVFTLTHSTCVSLMSPVPRGLHWVGGIFLPSAEAPPGYKVLVQSLETRPCSRWLRGHVGRQGVSQVSRQVAWALGVF